MLAASVCRVLVLLLGYLYPSYACFKALERRKAEGIRAWCEYWLVLAVFTLLESVGDQTVFWLPMYSETKVIFVLWLWHPRTQGAAYVYGTFLAPLLQRHEAEVDRHLAEASARVGDTAQSYYARATSYAHARFLHFVHSLPQQQQAAGAGGAPAAGGYVPRNASEAAAMAFMAAKQR